MGGGGRSGWGVEVNRLIDRLSSQEMEGTCSCWDAPRGQTSRGAAPRDIPVKRLAAQQKRREADASSNSTDPHTPPTPTHPPAITAAASQGRSA